MKVNRLIEDNSEVEVYLELYWSIANDFVRVRNILFISRICFV